MNVVAVAIRVGRTVPTSAGLGVWPAIGLGVLVFCVGIAVGATLLRLRSTTPVPAFDEPGQKSGPQSGGESGSEVDVVLDAEVAESRTGSPARDIDEAALFGALIELADRLPGARGQSALAAAFTACGIVTDRPVGSSFDATRHHVVDTDATTDLEQDMVIGDVERPGYLRRGECLRAADVVVLRYQPEPPAGAAR